MRTMCNLFLYLWKKEQIQFLKGISGYKKSPLQKADFDVILQKVRFGGIFKNGVFMTPRGQWIRRRVRDLYVEMEGNGEEAERNWRTLVLKSSWEKVARVRLQILFSSSSF